MELVRCKAHWRIDKSKAVSASKIKHLIHSLNKRSQIGLLGGILLCLLFVLLLATRAIVVSNVMASIAPSPVAMGLTALQQDSGVLALFLAFSSLSLCFRRHRLQVPFVIITIFIIFIYGVDLAVTKTLMQRLYLFDLLKFGKELRAITDFSGVFLMSFAGKVTLALSLPAVAIVFAALWPRPYLPRIGVYGLLCAALIALIGLWQPFTLAYIDKQALRNVLAVNFDTGIDKPYSPEFVDHIKKENTTPSTSICSPGQNRHPNIILVTVESLSMHQSALFGGFHDLTPQLDKLARNHRYFVNFFANGFTTDGGLIALINGKAPIPAINRYQSVNAFQGFEDPQGALPDVLHDAGYSAHFFTTGDLGFLDKLSWLKSLRFDSIEGAEQPFYHNWKRRHFNAAEDRALYLRLLQWIDQYHETKPYFVFALTVSTHPPFVNPVDNALGEANVFPYADRQLDMLYTELKRRDFFKNGLLLITGDHRSMTPLYAEEAARYGNTALARVPLIVIDNEYPQGPIEQPFQQTDLIPSLIDLTGNQACRKESEGWFLRNTPQPATYIKHARGDQRNRIDIYFENQQAALILNGDQSYWMGAKPIGWEKIARDIHADRIARGANKENALDTLIHMIQPQANGDDSRQ